MQGKVKWFNNERGYGFITGDNGEDVFVHHSNILMNGFRHLEEGQRVSYDVESSEKGNKAINVTVEQGKEE